MLLKVKQECFTTCSSKELEELFVWGSLAPSPPRHANEAQSLTELISKVRLLGRVSKDNAEFYSQELLNNYCKELYEFPFYEIFITP